MPIRDKDSLLNGETLTSIKCGFSTGGRRVSKYCGYQKKYEQTFEKVLKYTGVLWIMRRRSAVLIGNLCDSNEKNMGD
jgi:hypothetical protein